MANSRSLSPLSFVSSLQKRPQMPCQFPLLHSSLLVQQVCPSSMSDQWHSVAGHRILLFCSHCSLCWGICLYYCDVERGCPKVDGDEPAGDWATSHDSVHDVLVFMMSYELSCGLVVEGFRQQILASSLGPGGQVAEGHMKMKMLSQVRLFHGSNKWLNELLYEYFYPNNSNLWQRWALVWFTISY